jgi:hypothetical protein
MRVIIVNTPGPQGPPGLPPENAISASYALTASYAENASINTGSLVTTSSFNNFTSSYSTGSFTGSFIGELIGTASYVTGSIFDNINPVLSSSYALTASYAENVGNPSPISVTGSTLYSIEPLSTNTPNTFNNIFLGSQAGEETPDVVNSNFIGFQAGAYAFEARESNFLGYLAGNNASNAESSNFIGYNAGNNAQSSYNSNFIGMYAGFGAGGAYVSNFIGRRAGSFARVASYSNLIGYQAGRNMTTGFGIGPNNIIIGTNITLPELASNRINLGAVIFADGTYSTTTGLPFSGSMTNGKVGINNANPQYSLDVSGSGNYSNGLKVTGSVDITGSLTVNTVNVGANTINFVDNNNNILTSLSVENGNLILSTGSFEVPSGSTILATSSWATNALTASFLPIRTYDITSSWANNYNETDPVFVAVSGSLATTGSNTFNGTQNISGSLVVLGDVTIFGSSSLINITASQLNVGTNTISVNVFEPAQRFGGLVVYDSGSISHQATASLLWDSLNNHWVYQNASGSTYSGGGLISGPKNFGALGSETYPTLNRIVKGEGGDHITNSNISDNGSIVSINSNTEVTGSLTITQGITGSLFGTSSWSTNALTASYLDSYIPPFPFTGSSVITGSLIVTGSIEATHGITSSLFGTSSWAINYNEMDPIFTSVSESLVFTSSFNQYTSSVDSQISSLTLQTSSYVQNNQTSSMNVLSSSYSITASYALNSPGVSENLAIAYAIALG